MLRLRRKDDQADEMLQYILLNEGSGGLRTDAAYAIGLRLSDMAAQNTSISNAASASVQALLHIALDEAEPTDLRSFAIEALANSGITDTADALLPLLQNPHALYPFLDAVYAGSAWQPFSCRCHPAAAARHGFGRGFRHGRRGSNRGYRADGTTGQAVIKPGLRGKRGASPDKRLLHLSISLTPSVGVIGTV